MKRDGRGRHARQTSEYHLRLHVAAQEQACAMLAMLKTGKSYPEVGRAFGISGAAVQSRLKRQGLHK